MTYSSYLSLPADAEGRQSVGTGKYSDARYHKYQVFQLSAAQSLS